MKTQNEIEKEFRAIRGQLRLLRGQSDIWLAQEHEQEIDGFTPSCVKDIRQLRDIVNKAISAMDGYECVKQYNGEIGALQRRMFELSGWGRRDAAKTMTEMEELKC